jgi:hypothetical protein
MQVIEEVANEGSSFYPTITFQDENGQDMTPDTLKWKLTDPAGNVVNGRSEVTVGAPSTSITIALGGADLDVLGDHVAARVLTLWGTYTSTTHGSGQPFTFQALFNIQPRIGG